MEVTSLGREGVRQGRLEQLIGPATLTVITPTQCILAFSSILLGFQQSFIFWLNTFRRIESSSCNSHSEVYEKFCLRQVFRTTYQFFGCICYAFLQLEFKVKGVRYVIKHQNVFITHSKAVTSSLRDGTISLWFAGTFEILGFGPTKDFMVIMTSRKL